ncbi:MAG: hypothetical protein GF329_16230 [Candidatus Lokiarchaeota archaeon]|nr:hypothetical protein [Candidatus Lokiarchaeota archaeon]
MVNKNKNGLSRIQKEKLFAGYFWHHRNFIPWMSLRQLIPFLIGIIIIFTCAIIDFIFSSIFFMISIFILFYIINISIVLGRKIRSLKEINISFVDFKDNPKYFFIKDNSNTELDDVIFIENGINITAISCFKLYSIPIYILGYFDWFVRKLYKHGINFFWIQIQRPIEDIKSLIENDNIKYAAIKRISEFKPYIFEDKISKKGGFWHGSIILGVKVIIESNDHSYTTYLKLYDKVKSDLKELEIIFSDTFYSVEIKKMQGGDLIYFLNSNLIEYDELNVAFTGNENINHFLQIPKMIFKSFKFKFPAEFVVPTDLSYDIGPIGNSIETEFQAPEKEIGLSVSSLKDGIIVSGDSSRDRFQVIIKLLFEIMIQEYSIILITSDKRYRSLIDLIPYINVFPFGKYGFNILDNRQLDENKYIPLLTSIFEIVISNKFDIALNTILKSVYTYKGNTLHDLLSSIENQLKFNSSNLSYNEKQSLTSLKDLINNLVQGEATPFFTTNNIKLSETFSDSIFEIDIEDMKVKKLAELVILLRILLYCKIEPNKKLVVLIDDADLIFRKNGKYNNISEIDFLLIDLLKKLKNAGIIPILSISHPKNIIGDILSEFGNIFALKTKVFKDELAIRQPLNLSGRSDSSDEHYPLKYSEKRKYGYQFEYLKNLDSLECILKIPQANFSFPVKIDPVKLSKKNYNDQFIRHRIEQQHPYLIVESNVPQYDTELEKDFKNNIKDIVSILELLDNYPELSKNAIKEALDFGASELDYYLKDLQKYNYIEYKEVPSGNYTQHLNRLTKKGQGRLHKYQNFYNNKDSRNSRG